MVYNYNAVFCLIIQVSFLLECVLCFVRILIFIPHHTIVVGYYGFSGVLWFHVGRP